MDIKNNLILLAIFLLVGCAAGNNLTKPTHNTRQEYVNSHPQLISEIKQAILRGKVVKGMSKDDVFAAWGEPTRISAETSGEGWFYDQPFISFSPKKSVSFTKDGLVYDFSEIWLD